MELKHHIKGKLYISEDSDLIIMCTKTNKPYFISGTDPTILSGVVMRGTKDHPVGTHLNTWVRSKFNPL